MTHISKEIAKQFREVYFGGNWTSVNIKDTLSDVHWDLATKQVNSFNTIVTLVYHMGYYVTAVTKVLEGQPLEAKDKYSFDHPPVMSEQDWQQMQDKTFNEAEYFTGLIEKLPDNILTEIFADEKYGNYYRNLQGIIQHLHYHLGQIVILKKILMKIDEESKDV